MSFRSHNRLRVSLNTGEFSHTKQSCKSECDINNILKQFQKTGIINHINKSTANYTDLPSQIDYQEALNTVIEAESAFSQLPSKVRDRFKNNPAHLLLALNDPNMTAELQELGVLKKPPAASPPLPKTSAEANAQGVGAVQP